MFRALSPARRRLMTTLIVVSAMVVVGITFLIIRSRPDAVRPVAQGEPGPVLLVPGYGGSTTGLDVMARALRAAGRDATVVVLPGDGRDDLHAQAEALKTAVDSALSRSGAGSVDIIGYSAGGVVARLWVRDDGGASQARRVVTLGSPHHGTDLAAAAVDFVPSQCPAACRELAPDSDLLRALNSGDETPPGPLFVSIRSTSDRVVSADSAQLAGATNVVLQAVCPNARTSHSDLPVDPLVIAITELELGGGIPTTPPSADCAQLSS